MEIIRRPLDRMDAGWLPILVPAERRVLAKMRWRGVAVDGREFGFELIEPLGHGTPVFAAAGQVYVIAQRAEPVFRIPIADAAEGGRIGWMVGNLHFPAQIVGGAILVETDEAVRQLLVREGIGFSEESAVFQPIRAHAGHRH